MLWQKGTCIATPESSRKETIPIGLSDPKSGLSSNRMDTLYLTLLFNSKRNS
jgi:hypothetical protein